MKFVKNFCILLSIILVIGLAAGKIYGDFILSSSLRGSFSIFTYVFSPSQSFTDTYSLLNNSSDYKRLAGYYAYRDSGLIDLNFLYERYKGEDSDIIKSVIIWVAEDCHDKEKLVDFYKKLYSISPEKIQKNLVSKIEK